MALAKHLLLAACAGFCIAPCWAGDAQTKKPLKPETAAQRLRADQYGVQGLKMLLTNRAVQALHMFDVLIKQNPQSASLYAWRARLLLEATFERGLPADRKISMRNAGRDAESALTLDDKVSNAYYVRGRLFVIDNELEKGLLELNKAVELDADNVAALDADNVAARLWRSQLLEGERKPLEALKDLDVAVKLAPTSDSFCKRALVRRHLSDFKGAVEDYTQAYKIERAPHILEKRGETYELAKQYDKAIADTREAIKAGMSKSELLACHKRIARMFGAMDKIELAQKELEIVLKLNPEDFQSIAKHLEYAKKMKNWPAALADVNRMLDFENRYSGYYKERAEIYRAMGKTDLAAEDEIKYQQLRKKSEAPIR